MDTGLSSGEVWVGDGEQDVITLASTSYDGQLYDRHENESCYDSQKSFWTSLLAC